ncbi:MAG: hypothetical protein GWN18_00800 [Thermoplasmata archaeon]|nr:hypothetical protein [Thermoplasmata archaeon]NIS10538.1 hypothetical protein [Thermoplasmata archaeon]NIS18495.1 hypothetical protein [Thermoplasmata archaeon]NIT75483.1 hypothetical protein [Thermoplasmata archaeon]NIU47650.1 hypothetical protein [Thermoplasmata archaeon]
MLEELAAEGATLYVASDAHDSAGFRRAIPMVIEAHERLRDAGARFLLSMKADMASHPGILITLMFSTGTERYINRRKNPMVPRGYRGLGWVL